MTSTKPQHRNNPPGTGTPSSMTPPRRQSLNGCTGAAASPRIALSPRHHNQMPMSPIASPMRTKHSTGTARRKPSFKGQGISNHNNSNSSITSSIISTNTTASQTVQMPNVNGPNANPIIINTNMNMSEDDDDNDDEEDDDSQSRTGACSYSSPTNANARKSKTLTPLRAVVPGVTTVVVPPPPVPVVFSTPTRRTTTGTGTGNVMQLPQEESSREESLQKESLQDQEEEEVPLSVSQLKGWLLSEFGQQKKHCHKQHFEKSKSNDDVHDQDTKSTVSSSTVTTAAPSSSTTNSLLLANFNIPIPSQLELSPPPTVKSIRSTPHSTPARSVQAHAQRMATTPGKSTSTSTSSGSTNSNTNNNTNTPSRTNTSAMPMSMSMLSGGAGARTHLHLDNPYEFLPKPRQATPAKDMVQIQATNEAQASVQKLSEWLQDKPFDNNNCNNSNSNNLDHHKNSHKKKKKNTPMMSRSGGAGPKVMLAKSRVLFDTGDPTLLQHHAKSHIEIEATSSVVKDKKKWLQNAFGNGNGSADEPQPPAPSTDAPPSIRAVQSKFGGAHTPQRNKRTLTRQLSGVASVRHVLEQKQLEARLANDYKAHHKSTWAVPVAVATATAHSSSSVAVTGMATGVARAPPPGQYKKTTFDSRGPAPKKTFSDLP
jgi:hypothetical protein